jgi:hypothetical protein
MITAQQAQPYYAPQAQLYPQQATGLNCSDRLLLSCIYLAYTRLIVHLPAIHNFIMIYYCTSKRFSLLLLIIFWDLLLVRAAIFLSVCAELASAPSFA